MRRPRLNALRMFEAAGRHRNFRLTAEEMNLTQGAVAQQIRGLEADLGVALFVRKARGLELTDAGRQYHSEIARALGLIDQATHALHPDKGEVTISVPPSFAAKWLVPRISGLGRTHPEITLKVIAEEAVVDFRSGKADLSVRIGTAPDEAGVEHEMLAPLTLTAVAARGTPEAAMKARSIEDFASADLIQDAHGYWETLFRQAGVAPRGRMLTFNHSALAMDAAIAGQGVALVPSLFLKDAVEAGALVSLWTPAEERRAGFHVVVPKGARPEVRSVARWLMQQV